MARSRKRYRRKFKSNDTPLPRERKRKRGVAAVHPNSAAARVWKRTDWLYREDDG